MPDRLRETQEQIVSLQNYINRSLNPGYLLRAAPGLDARLRMLALRYIQIPKQATGPQGKRP